MNNQKLSLEALTYGENDGFESAFAHIVKYERPNQLTEFHCHPETQKNKKLCGLKDEIATPKTSGRVVEVNNQLEVSAT